jgi:hypothetical protein
MIPLPWQRTAAPPWIIPGVLLGGTMGSKKHHRIMAFFVYPAPFV